ncbi:B3 domain-containing transcription factor VRN1-like [Vicia villosa]|uniref:B3 domain-containing transcription factor VRN1-like n=1 Tax=Vicia villosa TaxID=3911 RepID=UPI00273B97F3|nr:B3 domain-containing transcription factor VRN1-like [Vicia villosa]
MEAKAEIYTVRFYKIITTPNVQDGKMRLPKDFTKKCISDMPNPIFLKTPDDKKWEIHTAKVDEDFWFEKGWKEFVTYYSLEYGNMIMFHYEENSHFMVNIFDKSTLEIEYPFQDNQNEQNNVVLISDDDSVENLDKSPSFKEKTNSKSSIPCPQSLKKLRSYNNEGVGTSTKFQNISKSPLQTSGDRRESKFYNSSKHHDQASDGNSKCQKEKQEQKQEQEQQSVKTNGALRRAKKFKSKNPFFTVVMKSSYLHTHFLYVPTCFTKSYMKKQKNDILLQLMDGSTWDAKYYFGRIQAGWKKFSADNKLKKGDVCVFELINCKTLTFKVLIFGHEKDLHSHLPQELVQREKDRVREKNTSRSKMFQPLMEKTEKTRESVELDVPNARHVLIGCYHKILHELQKFPEDHVYRKAVETITNQKLMVVCQEEDLEIIKSRLGCGQLEKLIEEAKDELKLIAYMIK